VVRKRCTSDAVPVDLKDHLEPTMRFTLT